MNRPPQPRRPGPPHNPGLRELIAGKRRWSWPSEVPTAKLGFQGWHERGYLPHRDEPGLTQFVTYHLHDAFPAALRSEWAALFEVAEDRERRLQLEAYLDKGRGGCHLRRPELASRVESSFRLFHGQRYVLRAWVVMPNHVHVLFKVGRVPMAQIVKGWKSYTARRASGLFRRLAKFWQEDYWDTFMRDADHEAKAVHYIESNPVKARLVREPGQWPWSSARFRDHFGGLLLPGSASGR